MRCWAAAFGKNHNAVSEKLVNAAAARILSVQRNVMAFHEEHEKEFVEKLKIVSSQPHIQFTYS